jgi:hypothetical protein
LGCYSGADLGKLPSTASQQQPATQCEITLTSYRAFVVAVSTMAGGGWTQH